MRKILVIGSSNTDFIMAMKRFPVAGETVQGTSFLRAMGGKGANQALSAHKMGGDVQFVTCLGKDRNGENTLKHYMNQKLDVSLSFVVDGVPSGTAMIWVDQKGENCIVVNPGSNGKLSPEHIDVLEEVIANAYIVVLQMEIPYETVKKICDIAYLNRTLILLNVAPACKIDLDLLQKIDILVVNETEAEYISGENINLLGEEAIVHTLKTMGANTVILTLGTKGCFFKNDDLVLNVPAFEVETVDTTAAGDIFCGALAVALGEGYDWEKTLKFATAASALCVTRLGAQSSIPTRKEVRKYLKANALDLKEKG